MAELINPVTMYLKSLLEMQEMGLPKRRTRIADRLGVSGPTVTKTVWRMERDGLVVFSDTSKQLSFSPLGFRVAVDVMRKHRLAEVFLDRIVGFDWAHLHEEASRWEHAIGEQVSNLLDDLLDHPQRSPYGNPIPPDGAETWDLEEEFPEVRELGRFLDECDGEGDAVIEWIGEIAQSDPAVLTEWKAAGLLPGARVHARRDGPVVLVDTGSLAPLTLPRALASQLSVRA